MFLWSNVYFRAAIVSTDRPLQVASRQCLFLIAGQRDYLYSWLPASIQLPWQ